MSKPHIKKKRRKGKSSFNPRRRRTNRSSTPLQVSQSFLSPSDNSSLVNPLIEATSPTQQQTTSTNTTTRSQVPTSPELLDDEQEEECLIVRRVMNYEKQNRMRVCISYIYESLYHQSYIDGIQGLYKNTISNGAGIISTIATTLKLNRTHYKTVKNVVLETISCINNGTAYEK